MIRKSVSGWGSCGPIGSVAGTTMSSAAIVSARLMTLNLLCCLCWLCRCFVVAFTVAILVVFIDVRRHHHRHHRRCRRSPCRRRPCRLRHCPRCRRHNVPCHWSYLRSWLFCTLTAGGGPSSPFSLGEGSVMAVVALALFVTLALFVALVFVVVTALIAAIIFADCCEPFVVYPHPSPHCRRRTTPPLPRHGSASAVSSSPSLLGSPPLAEASSTRPRSSLPRRILIVAGLTITALHYFP